MEPAERKEIRLAFQIFSDAALDCMAAHSPQVPDAYYAHVSRFAAALHEAEKAYLAARKAFGTAPAQGGSSASEA